MTDKTINVLMVCLGNICRSPTAEVVFRDRIKAAGLEGKITVDSAGTGAWHIGHAPDKRATQAAAARHYDMTPLRARKVNSHDFVAFDYLFAMDRENLQDLLAMCEPEQQHKVSLFLDYGAGDVDEVPDPYYSGADGFELVLDLVEQASTNLIKALADKHQLV
jgi:protein-tyrosine phosphatase